MAYKYKLGIIGCGNMAEAILSQITWEEYIPKDEIIVSDADFIKSRNFADKFDVSVAKDNLEVVLNSEYILLAVKPQSIYDLNISGAKINCLISIITRVSVDTLGKQFKPDKTVRIIPNTPAAVGEGMSAIYFAGCDDNDKKFINELFGTVGKVVEIEENQFNAVTAVSGSGPAYVYYFIESLVRAGEKQGLTYKQSLELAVQTVKGAAILAETSHLTLNEMIDKVCSPGGTTVEAMKVFKAKNIDKIIEEAVAAAAKRSKELGK